MSLQLMRVLVVMMRVSVVARCEVRCEDKAEACGRAKSIIAQPLRVNTRIDISTKKTLSRLDREIGIACQHLSIDLNIDLNIDLRIEQQIALSPHTQGL